MHPHTQLLADVLQLRDWAANNNQDLIIAYRNDEPDHGWYVWLKPKRIPLCKKSASFNGAISTAINMMKEIQS